MKIIKIIIFSFLILAFASIGYLVYDFFSTPKFSIYMINQSILKKDYKQFQKYVNVDQLVSNFIEQQIEFLKNQKEKQKLFQKIENTVKLKLLEDKKAEIKSTIISLIEQYFRSNLDKSIQKDDIFELHNKIFTQQGLITFLFFYYIDSIDCREDTICIVNIKLEMNKEKTKILRLEFIKENSIWKLNSIPNLIEFINN